MIKQSIATLSLLCACATANADITPYLNGDIGYADTDHDSGFTFSVGGGLQFNEHFELEAGYNDYGESGVVDITSYSLGVNLGGHVSETIRLYGILGAEYLEADGSISWEYGGIDFDDSSTEAFYGAGATFELDENFAFRARVLGHDSGDIITATIGFAYYF